MPGITPFRPIGAGASNQAYNVFKITFSQALADVPVLSAYDDYTITTALNTLFVGTTGSANLPLIAAVSGIQGTTSYPSLSGSPSGWFPASAYVGNAPMGTPNFLKGSVYGILLSASAPLAGGSVTFNLGYKLWNDLTTLSSMAGVVICQYQYTGAIPTPTFFGNSGTELAPNWTPLVPYATGVAPASGDTTQIRPCDTGKGANGDLTYRQTIPVTGAVFPAEIWAKNY